MEELEFSGQERGGSLAKLPPRAGDGRACVVNHVASSLHTCIRVHTIPVRT